MKGGHNSFTFNKGSHHMAKKFKKHYSVWVHAQYNMDYRLQLSLNIL